MAQREPKAWITVSGKHVPIYEGESKQDAYNRAVAKHNEETKERQIKEAAEQRRLANKAKPDSLRNVESNAKALGVDFSKLKEKNLKEYDEDYTSYEKLAVKKNKTADDFITLKGLYKRLKKQEDFAMYYGDRKSIDKLADKVEKDLAQNKSIKQKVNDVEKRDTFENNLFNALRKEKGVSQVAARGIALAVSSGKMNVNEAFTKYLKNVDDKSMVVDLIRKYSVRHS